ncbi:GRP family sugar transporter [Mycolicibacterium holsaticum]|uniref:Multidrug DMT transporter permease n=1 Tax=Mycolicibacterium holsaticum TaxID=152142 RepID=A0A1E3R4R0_9MYCO|nr:GRP family sugar transporter [Mycolicibacterium holsaticum]ODQ84885.1 multidrug DMT transporter permease [Mycolicibacterium holsaticum]
MTGWLFALGSALFYGTSDFVGGLASRRAHYVVVALLGQLAGLVLAGIAAVVVVAPSPTAGDLWWGALSGVGTAAGLVFLFRGMSHGAMSVVVPTSAVTGIALSALVSVALGERPSLLAWAGIAIAVPALWWVSSGQQATTTTHSGGAGDGLLAGVGIAVQYLALAQASPASGLWPVATGRVGALGILVVALVFVGRQALRPSQGPVVLALVSGVLAASALISYLLATQHQIVAVAVALASLYPVIPVLLGILVLHERLTRRQTIGLLAAGAATLLMAG